MFSASSIRRWFARLAAGLKLRDDRPVVTLLGVKGLESTSVGFRRGILDVAGRRGLVADWLAAVMGFETISTFSPSIKNPRSGCIGLIQFCGPARRRLGVSSEELAAMTAEAQLTYVERYYADVQKSVPPVGTAADHYLVVFAPAGVGKDPSYPLYRRDGPRPEEYEQNREMDRDGDGIITVGDVTRVFLGYVAAAEQRPRVPVPGGALGGGGSRLGAGAIVVGLAGALAWVLARRGW